MKHALLLLALLLTSCVSDPQSDSQGGAAPITHEPYGSEMRDFNTHLPADINWKSGPASLPAGSQIAVLEGDPAKEGPFVFRLKLRDGLLIKPHMHPRAERVTVLQGTFNIAMRDTVEKAQQRGNFKTMTDGAFGYWPARMPHVAWVEGETIVQLHGYGPWMIEYLNPADDPRNAKR